MTASPNNTRDATSAEDDLRADGMITEILAVLRHGSRFMVCSHARPDGDAVGSMLAMGMLLQQMGKQVDLLSADRAPHVYRMLPGVNDIQIKRRVDERYDAVILLECDGLERTGLLGIDGMFLINIDHHFSGQSYGRLNWIDQCAASVGQMVYRLALAADAEITQAMATCLYTTLLTDTGGFQYGSVDASTFEMARNLVAAGAEPVHIAQQVSFSTPMSKMLLLGAALQNLQREGRVSWLWVTQDDMVRTCAVEEDSEGIVNFAIGISDIEVAAFLRELPDGRVRVSLRSKGKVNVASIAEKLGGGGHKTAAGFTLDWPLANARNEIPARLQVAMASLAEVQAAGD